MLRFSCDNCGNTTAVVRVDEENDTVLECLACEDVELISENMEIKN